MQDEVITAGTKIALIQGDITLQRTDAIVNAANSGLRGGGGVDGAIHRAGGSSIYEECQKIISRIGKLDTGKAVITTGGRLKAKYVIHTVGPVWHGGQAGEAALLASSYVESLKIATSYRLLSISFPSISTGAYQYPLQDAAKVALEAVALYLKINSTSLREIRFVLFDKYTFDAYQKVLSVVISML